jgi:DNA replication initiation complex subunit (GINS family)
MEKNKLTHDLVHQVYQAERQNALLSQVDKDFYEKVAELIKGLKEDYEEVSRKAASSSKAMVLLDELKKIQTLVREIYEYRIRKVALMALTAASEGTVDKKNMVGREIAVYENIYGILKEGYEEILRVEEGTLTIGAVDKATVEKRPAEKKEAKAEKKATSEEPIDIVDKGPSKEPAKADAGKTKKKQKNVNVLILEDIPRYMGEGGEVYHLKKKDYASMPLAMAKRLEKQGKARIMPS